MSDRLERTLAGLRQALAVSPGNAPLWLQVAEILDELGRSNEAVDAAREALRHSASGAGGVDDTATRDGAKELLARLQPAEEPAARSGVLRLVPGGRKDDEDEEDDEPLTIFDRQRLTFADIGGLDAFKETIRMRIVLPFERPEIFKAYGKKQGGGILLYGPPGCGKTMLARATAGECQAEFLNVAIDEVLDMWYGESERKLGAIFARARQHAPCVLFFDELEAIGGSRQQMRHSPGKSLVNQLLAEMDGVVGANDRVLVMAATNAPWHVDPALRRPGRFDRVLFVPPPDKTARVEILRLQLRDRPTAGDVDLSDIADRTPEFSGADLADLVERAIETPLREALRGGEQRPVRREDFKKALGEAKPTTREWFATAKNYATFANTGGLYDDLTEYLKQKR